MSKYAVIDFQTTGLSARAIEISAVLVENGRITHEYQSLINPRVRVPTNITQLTGISHAMVQDASECRTRYKGSLISLISLDWYSPPRYSRNLVKMLRRLRVSANRSFCKESIRRIHALWIERLSTRPK
jgi:hypothetical protein